MSFVLDSAMVLLLLYALLVVVGFACHWAVRAYHRYKEWRMVRGWLSSRRSLSLDCGGPTESSRPSSSTNVTRFKLRKGPR